MFKKAASVLLAAGLAVAAAFAGVPTDAQAATTTTYNSELTGEPISTTLQNQRPVAVMIDNDKRAYPHYGLSDADIVYEFVNSTLNNRVTRLMAIYKDWGSETRIGNIRSTRPTNIMTAAEYNAVLIHDGGPWHNNAYFKSTGIAHLSGSFSRISNGKAVEFTEYVTTGQIAKRLASAGYSSNYTQAVGNHFNFAPYGTEVNLAATYGEAVPTVNKVTLPYAHTSSQLVYNTTTGTYDYYEFGSPCVDGLTKKTVTFKNVIIQDVDLHQLDSNGYLVMNCVGTGLAYYLTDGRMVPVTWSKASYTDKTHYYDAAGNEIQVNCGKTYVTYCPSDSFTQILFQ